uniref:Uncharacterized protein n=1 Tax=Lygus hesperus TaxID=30085 RepID=A0A146KX98_LYGHE
MASTTTFFSPSTWYTGCMFAPPNFFLLLLRSLLSRSFATPVPISNAFGCFFVLSLSTVVATIANLALWGLDLLLPLHLFVRVGTPLFYLSSHLLYLCTILYFLPTTVLGSISTTPRVFQLYFVVYANFVPVASGFAPSFLSVSSTHFYLLPKLLCGVCIFVPVASGFAPSFLSVSSTHFYLLPKLLCGVCIFVPPARFCTSTTRCYCIAMLLLLGFYLPRSFLHSYSFLHSIFFVFFVFFSHFFSTTHLLVSSHGYLCTVCVVCMLYTSIPYSISLRTHSCIYFLHLSTIFQLASTTRTTRTLLPLHLLPMGSILISHNHLRWRSTTHASIPTHPVPLASSCSSSGRCTVCCTTGGGTPIGCNPARTRTPYTVARVYPPSGISHLG